MSGDSFYDKLTQRYDKTGSLLCVGLDPQPQDVGNDNKIQDYIHNLVDATKDYALAYKANVAYFEQFGLQGYIALEGLRNQIPPEIPLILDAKRGDIGVSAKAYAKALYDKLHADAITVNGYLGTDSITPFTNRAERGVFVLCRTSNPSAKELQELTLDGTPVYLHIAELARRWNENHNIGLVVGATCSQQLAEVRKKCPEMWILAPGVGAQGGDLQTTIKAGLTSFGGILINVGRAISRSSDPQSTAKDLVEQMRAVINDHKDDLTIIADTIDNCKHRWRNWNLMELDMPRFSCTKCGEYNGYQCIECRICYDCL